jgi:hypothetical protein
METQPDFKELLELFNKNKVEYLIVGGYALAFHGRPRMTGDIDILISPDPLNAKRILAALRDFGFGSLNLAETDFTRPHNVVQLGTPPVRIDLLTSLTGVAWQEAAGGRVLGKYGDVPVFYIGREQLLINKRTTGRAQDAADVEALGGD